jgi:hypothetical protein
MELVGKFYTDGMVINKKFLLIKLLNIVVILNISFLRVILIVYVNHPFLSLYMLTAITYFLVDIDSVFIITMKNSYLTWIKGVYVFFLLTLVDNIGSLYSAIFWKNKEKSREGY